MHISELDDRVLGRVCITSQRFIGDLIGPFPSFF